MTTQQITNYLQLPDELIVKTLGFLDPYSRGKVALSCRRLSAMAREVIRTISFSIWTLDAPLRRFVEHFPRNAKTIKVYGWTCGQLTDFLNHASVQNIEVLRVSYGLSSIMTWNEDKLGNILKKLPFLRVLQLTGCYLRGLCLVPEIKASSLILEDCQAIQELIVPESVTHLDVSGCNHLVKIRGLARVSLLRHERSGNFPMDEFHGETYEAKMLLPITPKAKSFLERGANPDALNIEGKTLLHKVVALRRNPDLVLAEVNFLLAFGADPNAQRHNHKTVLEVAENQEPEVIFRLLNVGARTEVSSRLWNHISYWAKEKQDSAIAALAFEKISRGNNL